MPDRGELTSGSMRRLVLTAQAKKERQHFRDRKLLMNYEKQRAENQHDNQQRHPTSLPNSRLNATQLSASSAAVKQPSASQNVSMTASGSTGHSLYQARPSQFSLKPTFAVNG